jgi:hypothetical protein
VSRALGLRVEPAAVHFAIVEGTADAPVLVADDRYAAPKGFQEAEALSWYRSRTRVLLNEHRPDRAAMKYMESVAGRGRPPRSTDSTRRRHRIEGVLLQLLEEEGVPVRTGPFATVAAGLGSKSAKAYVEAEDLRGLDWSGKRPLAKEAILTAVAALGAS